jgi:integrase
MSKPTSVFHPCGQQWREIAMAIVRRKDSGMYWYDFTIDGSRHRGSTQTKKLTEARAIEAALIVQAKEQGSDAVRPVRSPVLRDFALRFLDWVQSSRLEPNSKRYYQYGWKLMSSTQLANMQISRITSDDVGATRFLRTVSKDGATITIECSAQYTNQAIRTLKRMLSKAEEWRLLKKVPKIKSSKVYGRDTLIDPSMESLLLNDLNKPVKHKRILKARKQLSDILVIGQDTGMRPNEIFRMRIEHIDWVNMRIWNPYGKTAKSRRFVPMSQRLKDLLHIRCEQKREGWLFPSERSKTGHLRSINVGFRSLRRRLGLSEKVVPYCARHTYGSYTMEATGNAFAVADSMGHVDLQSMKPYQHHRLDPLREAIDRRNEANGSRHVLRHGAQNIAEVGIL